MSRIFIFLMVFITSLTNTYGQSSPDPIVLEKVFGGYQFYQGEKRLNMSQLVKRMESNEQAHKEIKKAQSTYTTATIIGAVGGFMVGWPLGTAMGGGDPNWAMAGIGAGLILVTIPISQKFNKQAKAAVDIFNEGIKTSSFWDEHELRLGSTGHGIGISLRF